MTAFPDPLDVTVELAFGADPDGDPDGWSWTDVTADVKAADGVQITRGRSDESVRTQPSTCRFALRNDGGDYTPGLATSPHYPHVRLGVPVRVTVTYSMADHRLFSGFVSEWKPVWPQGDLSTDTDPGYSRVEVACAGLLRRLEQGEQPLGSALSRAVSSHPQVVAYWPCEDGRDAHAAASPLPGVRPINMPDVVEFAAFDDVPRGSAPLPRFPAGAPGWVGSVPMHTTTGSWRVDWLFRMDEQPDDGTNRTAGRVITTSPGASTYVARVGDFDGGDFRLQVRDADDILVLDVAETPHPGFFGGGFVRLSLVVSLVQGDVVATLIASRPGERDALNTVRGVISSADLGRVTQWRIDPLNSTPEERSYGQITVASSAIDPWASAGVSALDGFAGEPAAARIRRLCDEEGIAVQITAPQVVTAGLRVTGQAGDHASTPDAAALDITGDIDLRAEVTLDDWVSGRTLYLLAKYDQAGDQRSYALRVTSDGMLELAWSSDGTEAGVQSPRSTAKPTFPLSGRLAVRATLDVDDGGDNTTTFYTAPSIDGPWTQLGDPVTRSGTTSIHSGTAALTVSGASDGTFGMFSGIVHAARVLDGIDGTPVADVDFEAQTIGDTEFDDDEGLTWTVHGDAAIVAVDDSMPMGPQQPATLTDLLRECADTDGGILGEARDEFGLTYRTRTTLYNQDAALELDARPASGPAELAPPFTPTADDQQARNDVTASRPAGTSARAVDTGDVDARGRYDATVTVNPSSDEELAQIAHWRLHLGTWPGMRYPQLSPALAQDPDLIPGWVGLALGDRVQVSNLPPQHPAGDVDLLVQGTSETLTPTDWRAVANMSPAGPYTVFTVEDDELGRADTAGATLGSAIDEDDTTLTVVSTGRPWINTSDHGAQFPFTIEVGGEEMTVSAISGSTSPQVFTVTRSANGVVKSHDAGSAVRLASRHVLAL